MTLPVTFPPFETNMVLIHLQRCKEELRFQEDGSMKLSPPIDTDRLSLIATTEMGRSFELPQLVKELNQITLNPASKLKTVERINELIRSFPGINIEPEPGSISIARSMIDTAIEHCKVEFRKIKRMISPTEIKRIAAKLIALATTRIGHNEFMLSLSVVHFTDHPRSPEEAIGRLNKLLNALNYTPSPSGDSSLDIALPAFPVTTPPIISGPAAPPAPAKPELIMRSDSMALPVTFPSVETNIVLIYLQNCKVHLEYQVEGIMGLGPPIDTDRLSLIATTEMGRSFELPQLVEELSQTTLNPASKLKTVERIDQLIRNFPGIDIEPEPGSIAIARSMIDTAIEHCKVEFRKIKREISPTEIKRIAARLIALATTRIGGNRFMLSLSLHLINYPHSPEEAIERINKLITSAHI